MQQQQQKPRGTKRKQEKEEKKEEQEEQYDVAPEIELGAKELLSTSWYQNELKEVLGSCFDDITRHCYKSPLISMLQVTLKQVIKGQNLALGGVDPAVSPTKWIKETIQPVFHQMFNSREYSDLQIAQCLSTARGFKQHLLIVQNLNANSLASLLLRNGYWRSWGVLFPSNEDKTLALLNHRGEHPSFSVPNQWIHLIADNVFVYGTIWTKFSLSIKDMKDKEFGKMKRWFRQVASRNITLEAFISPESDVKKFVQDSKKVHLALFASLYSKWLPLKTEMDAFYDAATREQEQKWADKKTKSQGKKNCDKIVKEIEKERKIAANNAIERINAINDM
jgi:hypothetical protein